jgi:asparagine synthase (glutamine-hydrolysing)
MGWMQQFRTESHSSAFTPEFARAVSDNGGWVDHMNEAFLRTGNSGQRSSAKSAQWVDSTTYLPGDLMAKSDRMSMAHGLEVRSPFLDHHLMEFASTIPGNYAYSGKAGKQILKQAYSDLIPSEIVNRKKAGFTVPMSEWINGPLRGITQDLLTSEGAEVHKVVNSEFIQQMIKEHADHRSNHAVRLWNLICLETWSKTFGVSLG